MPGKTEVTLFPLGACLACWERKLGLAEHALDMKSTELGLHTVPSTLAEVTSEKSLISAFSSAKWDQWTRAPRQVALEMS